MFAQAIHHESGRRDKPFVAVNCAAIPTELIESELFGYERGSFTGAVKEGKKGIFEYASGDAVPGRGGEHAPSAAGQDFKSPVLIINCKGGWIQAHSC